MKTRRDFLNHALGGVVVSASIPSFIDPGSRGVADMTPGEKVKAENLLDKISSVDVVDESYWDLVKEAFSLKPDLLLMHAANLCPSPISVQNQLWDLTLDVDQDASAQNRRKFSGLQETSRTMLAGFLGANSNEIAIVRNTSAANATVVNGLDLGPGDEVVLWDQNHPTNSISWDVRAERYGFTVKRVGTPVNPKSPEDVIRPFQDALTSKTRLLSFSHVSNISGVKLPAKRLCALAHSNGSLAMVDGAQSFGCLDVDLHDIGCDFYTGSAHKWFLGPREAGVLYVRGSTVNNLWATHVGVGWENAVRNGARKFEVLGQRDDAAVAAVATTVRFHETLGKQRVEARVLELASALKNGLGKRISGTHFHTPLETDMSGGVVVFLPPGSDARSLVTALYEQYGVAGAAMGGAFTGVRLCPHIYNTMEDVERVIDAVESLAS